ncbi:MAG TPA: hypothetical protein VKU03_10930, partial [Roseiarcus sp.]|nr:hypothetical protein [Roseiarcus sp.]
ILASLQKTPIPTKSGSENDSKKRPSSFSKFLFGRFERFQWLGAQKKMEMRFCPSDRTKAAEGAFLSPRRYE